MNKLFSKIIGASLAIAMMIGVGVGVNATKVATEANADDTPVSFTTGSNTVAIKVNYNSAGAPQSNNGIRMGTSNNAGSATFSIPSGTTKFGFYAVGWSGKATTASVSASVGTLSATTASLTSNSAASGNINADSTVSITETEANAKKEFTISNVTADSTITLTTSGSNKRLIAWNAWYETNGGGDTPATYTVTYNANGATSGTVPVDNTKYKAGDEVTVIGNTGHLEKDGYTFGGWTTNGEDELEADDSFVISTNTTLTAIWNIESGLDILNRSFTGVSGTGYVEWSGKAGQSGAVYAGNTAGGNDSIQLRDNNNSGLISTTSAGNIRKVTVTWEGNTANGRTLNVYGKNTAYSSTSELYDASTRGTSLGTIVKGTSTSLTITDDYRYVGICSNSGSMYLSELRFKWEEVQLNPRVEFSPTSLTLKTNQVDGAQVTALVEDVAEPTYSWVANDNNVTLENETSATVTIKPNTQVAAESTVTLTVGGTTPNLVETLEITIEIPGPGETAGTAYTVVQAKAAIAAADSDVENVYIAGKVSQIDDISLSNHNATYWISDDGETSDQFKIYRGKYINNANFTSNDQIIVGDEVIVYGTISKQHGSLNQDNYIVSMNPAPRVTSIVLNPNEITAVLGSDGDIADLFTNITINQETGSNKTVNDITWTSENEEIFCVVDGNKYLAGDVHRSSTTIHAFIGKVEFASATVTIFRANTHVMEYNLPEEWREVTNPSTLVAGDRVILTGIKNDTLYAAGTYAEGNNVPANQEHALTESNGVITNDVLNEMIYTLEAGTEPGSLAFKDSAGKYLYAASSDKNYMKSQDAIDDNASFILNANGTVVAQGTYTHNYMRYNPNGNNNSLFSCYASNSSTGSLVKFYKFSTGTAELDLFNLSSIAEANDDENGTYIRLGASLSEEDWAAMDSAFDIAGYGVMLIRETTLEATTFDTIAELYNSNDSENKAKLSNRGKDSDTAPQDFSVAAKINISNDSDRAVVFCAATYVKASDGTIYFINETRGSLVGLL